MISFAALPCRKKNFMTARVSILLKSCASHDMLLFSLCNKTGPCNSSHEQTSLSNDATDSVPRHRELGRAKDLSAPLSWYRYIFIYFLFILEDISNRLKLGNACYHSVQNLLSSSFISTNIKIKINTTIILSMVLYGCETWSLTMRGEN